jgi:hypothetical protein
MQALPTMEGTQALAYLRERITALSAIKILQPFTGM